MKHHLYGCAAICSGCLQQPETLSECDYFDKPATAKEPTQSLHTCLSLMTIFCTYSTDSVATKCTFLTPCKSPYCLSF